jgi:hypothetical protein
MNLNVTDYLNPEYFTSEEVENVMALIKNCGHRREFRNIIKNINNYNYDKNAELGSFLRYVNEQQLEGLFTLMRLFSNRIGIDKLFNDQYFTSLYQDH